MKEFLKKYTKKLWRIALIIEIIFVVALFVFVEFYYGWLGLGISVTDKSEEVAVIIYRNRGFALAAIVGLLFTLIGFVFTAWGRKQTKQQIELSRTEIELSRAEIELSRKANASERYENAARMLGDQVLAVRIAGCHALENLAIDDEKMTTQCIQLLSTFIVNPFDDKNEPDKKKTENEPIKQDTQAAVNGLSAISLHYYEEDKEIVLYVADLKNANLTGAHLIEADLAEADLKNVDFKNAKLSGACLIDTGLGQANLTNADLGGSELSGADLTGAELRGANLTRADLTAVNLIAAKNLTKEQVLSAKFNGTPPYLPEKLLQDKEIQEWLAKYQQENEDL